MSLRRRQIVGARSLTAALACGLFAGCEAPGTRTSGAPAAGTTATRQAPPGALPTAPARTAIDDVRTDAPRASSLRPAIVDRRISYPRRRRVQMAAYSERHYGQREHRLRRPRVIVQHYTVNDSVDATRATFDRNGRDPELRELPGVCAHFVIGADGRIFQLVPLRLRCRHTVGLNHVAIGIEHVGRSDADVMERPRVLRSSLRLTRWLRCRYGIDVRDVIGHSESVSSRRHLERVPHLRTQTHADMTRRSMRRYRRLLRTLGCR